MRLKLRFWVLSSVIDFCLTRTWQHVMSSQTSILKSFVLYWTFALPGFTGRGRLLLAKWRSGWMFYHLTTMLWWWECLAHLLLTSSSWAAFIASCCFTVWNLEVFSWQVPELSEFFLDCWLSDEYKRSELEQERIQRRQCQVNCDGYRIIG